MIQRNYMIHKILNIKNSTICTNCKKLSIQSPQLNNSIFYTTFSH